MRTSILGAEPALTIGAGVQLANAEGSSAGSSARGCRHCGKRPSGRIGKIKKQALWTGAAIAAGCSAAPGHATLVIEPVFNAVAGTGPAETVVGFYLPGLINPATGLPFLTADEPGEIITYPAGFPADPLLADTLRFYNNTNFAITEFTISIVGMAVEPEPFNFTVTRGPVDAIFGDANFDGLVGLSDIFSTVEVSGDGKTITFSDGLIAPGGRFTDFNFARTTDQQPFLAAFDASFQGYAVPEPSTWAMMLLGFGLVGGAMRSAKRRRKIAIRYT